MLCEDIKSLEKRIQVQNGMSPEEPPPNSDWSKIIWNDVRFGAPVVVECEDGYPDEYGYLTTLPPYHDEDMEGVIHFPNMWGEKQSAGPGWITLIDCTAIEGVKRIVVGEKR